MRFEGRLAKWNDERGFGFIAPTQGGQEIFVHISSFPRDGRRPRVDEPLSFELELSDEGKKRAVGVLRPERSRPYGARSRPIREVPGVLKGAVALVLLIVVGAYGYREYSRSAGTLAPLHLREASESRTEPSSEVVPTNGRCDGRIYCSQMTSCAEAKFFLKNCPGTRMDGNNDGVPCEQQWCTSPFAK